MKNRIALKAHGGICEVKYDRYTVVFDTLIQSLHFIAKLHKELKANGR